VGDAITQQMLHVQGHLSAMGIRSEIYAEHIDNQLGGRVRPIDEYEGSNSHLLLFHHSMGNEAFEDVIVLPNDVVAIYHNITPERYFSNEVVRNYVRLGRDQLLALARRAQCGVADSNFNRREMLAAGFKRVEVLPVRTDFSDFYHRSSSEGFRSSDWLFVGRLVGNKCQHDIVRAFAIYSKSFDDSARLILIGDTSDSAYVDFIRSEAEKCGIADRVVMRGKVSHQQLKSAFRASGVFVSMSEHEGFGVPILEAMASDLPVVAYGAAAVPETMGGAGILLRSKDPAVVAATVQSIRNDEGLRERLLARQRRRVDQVQRFDIRSLLKRLISRASSEADRPLQVQEVSPQSRSEFELRAIDISHRGTRRL
jgi:glycosyltransferase involved in cell wall biosynthesis